ncbi:hypothetical protein STEG23_031442 [Scotinomys teguina]
MPQSQIKGPQTVQNQSSGTVTLPGCGAVHGYQTKHRRKGTLIHALLCAIPIRFQAMLSTVVSPPPPALFGTGADAPIKQCPVCRIYIERNEGCAQMMCKNCKHTFCWYCLQNLDMMAFLTPGMLLAYGSHIPRMTYSLGIMTKDHAGINSVIREHR